MRTHKSKHSKLLNINYSTSTENLVKEKNMPNKETKSVHPRNTKWKEIDSWTKSIDLF